MANLIKTTNKRTAEWETYQQIVPASLLNYLKEEALASSILVFDPMHIPGLLQTESYARMAIAGAGIYQFNEAAVEARVQLRMDRQFKLMDQKNPPKITVMLDEATLHRHAHGAEILREQLMHLIELANLPMITLRVIPFEVGVYSGMDTGSFTVLSRIKPSSKEFVFKGEVADFSSNELEVYIYKQSFESLISKALDESSTVALIQAIAREL